MGPGNPYELERLRRACSPNWLARARSTAPLLKRSGRPTTMPPRGRASLPGRAPRPGQDGPGGAPPL